MKSAETTIIADMLTTEDADPNLKVINSRFGPVQINIEKAINFPYGLLGIPGNNYCLAQFPNEAFKRFKILQSVEDHKLAFITYPLENIEPHSPNLIDMNDLVSCSHDLNIPLHSMVILLVTTVYHAPDPEGGLPKAKITVNMRAPLIIDTRNNTGVQYVFNNDKYLIRYELF